MDMKGEDQFGATQDVDVGLRRGMPIEEVRSDVGVDDNLAHSAEESWAARWRSA